MGRRGGRADMGRRLRAPVLLLCLGVLALGIIFRQSVLAFIIEPAATAIWLFLRLFVLGIPQAVFWWGAISLALVVMIWRLARGRTTASPHPQEVYSAPRDQVGLWRSSIIRGTEDSDSFRRELMWLFTEMYASRSHGTVTYKVREALKERLTPIPETVHSFLFAEKPTKPLPPFFPHPLHFLRLSLRAAEGSIRMWFRRKTGRARTDYLVSIEETLKYMEDHLEMKHDDA